MRALVIVALALVALPAQAAGLAWRVSGDTGATLYLVGTIHAATEDFYPLPEPIESAFARADVLVVEVDMASADPREAQAITRRHGMLSRRESLHELLGDDTWAAASAWAERVGVSERTLERMQPWLAAITLVTLEMRRLGLDPELGMERHFGRRAAERGMRVVELETAAAQLRMLADLPRESQVRFLEGSIADRASFEESVDRIIGSWRRGDSAALAALLSESYTDPVLYAALMRDRNQAWLSPIERMLHTGRVHFVAVGALHLVGDDGLVALLESRGYRLERL